MSDRIVNSSKIVIGTEVHLQLLTASKMYCPCPNDFHAEPNTLTCPVCLGTPGALPVINDQSYTLGLIAARALGCMIHRETRFDRKNYFYPDLTKGYQITQFFHPLATGGQLEFPFEGGVGSCRIERIHIEEDSGKMTHQDDLGESWVDFNRCGVPLIEIVSKPDLTGAADTSAYLEELRLLMKHLRVSDCEMQEGSLRCDLNVNLHLSTNEGEIATPIVEVKNLNSFSQVRNCVEAEAIRQQQAWIEDGRTIENSSKETRGWDDVNRKTLPQRVKEGLADYRYFPEPDLPPFFVSDERLSALPRIETPREAIARVGALTGEDKADLLVQAGGRETVEAWDTLVKENHDPLTSANLLTNEIFEALNDRRISIGDLPVSLTQIGDLIDRIHRKEFAMRVARRIFKGMLEDGSDAAIVMEREGLSQIDDDSELRSHCESVIGEFTQAADDFRSGKQAALNGLMGRVMQRTKGQANPGKVREMLQELLTTS